VITIDRNSWHYKMAVFGLLDESAATIDLCRYVRSMIFAVLGPLAIVSIGAFIGFVMVVAPLALVAVWVTEQRFVLIDSAAIAGLFVWSMGLSAAALSWLVKKAASINIPFPCGSLIGEIYRGWKEKTCVLVEIKDGK